MRRLLLLTGWTLREPAYWRISLLILLVVAFSLASIVVRASGPADEPPEATVANVLDVTTRLVVLAAYPFFFPLISVLSTLALASERESGALAALHTLGYRRWEIVVSRVLAVLFLVFVPSMLAFLALPPVVEPRLLGNIAALYPFEYWASMPRLLLAAVFLTLFATSFALLVRRVPTAFGAMITFFFVGWYIEGPLGSYRILAPPTAFGAAYGLEARIPGLPIGSNLVFTVYLSASIIVFLTALAMAHFRGELQ